MRYLLAALSAVLLLAGCEPRPADSPADPADSTAIAAGDSAARPLPTEPSRAVMRPAREPLDLRFPTGNDALFDDPAAFYSPLDRDQIPGLRNAGWEGGQYGFVRSPARGSRGMIFSRPHEGLDIRPLHFDARSEPTDTVRAISDGRVVYANRRAGSSYGRYVVVEHRWDGAPVYSLYAHLERVDVRARDSVAAGDPLGRLGYTGRGTAKHRAHVHLEVNLLLNEHFDRYFDEYYRGRNLHGLYFGRNLAGLDAEALYRTHRHNPTFSFPAFVRQRPAAYRVAIPGTYPLDLLERYPWMADDGATAPDSAGAWVVSFTQEGVPVRVARRDEPVEAPEVVWVADRIERHRLSTNGMIARGDSAYHLTRDGRAAAALLATSERGVPPWF
jgi:murein DD-endopeptidase MepM/ murein hydrolase activator NlpD